MDAGLTIRLASASPRRIELLGLTGWMVLASPTQVDESAIPGEDPVATTRRLALAKVRAAAGQTGEPIVVAADTLVVHGDQTLGKPADRQQAAQMLSRLRGQEHTVVTSIAIFDRRRNRLLLETCMSLVPMRSYSAAELAAYVQSERPLDKAGAYGIQDQDFRPVDLVRMQDCFANVMGLPLCHLTRAMRGRGYEPPADVPTACQELTGYKCPVFQGILEGRQ